MSILKEGPMDKYERRRSSHSKLQEKGEAWRESQSMDDEVLGIPLLSFAGLGCLLPRNASRYTKTGEREIREDW